jgi:hypothetical protein
MENTNIQDIIQKLNENRYSVQDENIVYNGQHEWETKVFEFNVDEMFTLFNNGLKNIKSSYIDKNIYHFTLKDGYIISLEVNIKTIHTDGQYYFLRPSLGEGILLGLPVWILSCGTLLIYYVVKYKIDEWHHEAINKIMQSGSIKVHSPMSSKCISHFASLKKIV